MREGARGGNQNQTSETLFMKTTLLAILVSATIAFPVFTASSEEVLHNDSVVQLINLKLGDSVVIQKIKTSQCDFDTTVEAMAKLKAAGVSNDVILAMVATKSTPPTATKPETADTPSVEQAKEVLQSRIDSQSKGNVKLINFTKTDGQSVNSGVQGYRLFYTAEIEFEQNGLWTTWAQNGYLGFEFSPGVHAPQTATMQLLSSVSGDQEMHRGQRITIAGVINGEKSERGWNLSYGANQVVENQTSQTDQGQSQSTDDDGQSQGKSLKEVFGHHVTYDGTNIDASAAADLYEKAAEVQANAFDLHTKELQYRYDQVWDALLSQLTEQKESILQSNKKTGILTTKMTRHGFINPYWEKLSLTIEKAGDSSTKVSFKLFQFKQVNDFDKGEGHLDPLPNAKVNPKAEAFLDKIVQRLRASK